MILTTDYVTLNTSLPHLGGLFYLAVQPISRIQLDKRLSILSDDDKSILLKIENLLQWDHLTDAVGESGKDEQLIQKAEELLSLLSLDARLATVVDVIQQRLNLRSIIAALRCRQNELIAGKEQVIEYGSYGHFDDHIRRHWDHPTFALEYRFPWLKKAHDFLVEKDIVALEKLLLDISWKSISVAQQGHTFDFVSVILYVLKWNIAIRWQSYDNQLAVERFNQMLDRSMKPFFKTLQ